MKELVKKELIIAFRTIGGIFILVPIGVLTCLFILPKDSLEQIADTIYFNDVLIISFKYIPMMVIPMVYCSVFQSVLNEERSQRIITVLLANGIKLKKLWISKNLACIVVSYFLTAISSALSIICIKIMYGYWIRFNLWQIFNDMLIFPLVGFAISEVIVSIMWFYKKAQIITGMLPSIGFLACMYLNMYKTEFNINPLLLTFVTIIIFWGINFIVLSVVAHGGNEVVSKNET